MHGCVREPGQGLTAAAISVPCPVLPVSWPPSGGRSCGRRFADGVLIAALCAPLAAPGEETRRQCEKVPTRSALMWPCGDVALSQTPFPAQKRHTHP